MTCATTFAADWRGRYCFEAVGAPASMAGRLENLLLLNGFSKIAAMTGWRVGYAAGPEQIIQQMIDAAR